MIGRLSGRLAYRAEDHVLIDVGGVGYVVFVSSRTRAGLPQDGEAVTLWTDLLVREDLMQLFGFPTLQEKEWHRLLTSVQGVGARAALAILGALGADGVGRAIALGDVAAIRAAPGVGPKLAARVVNELTDKAPAVMALPAEATAPHKTGDTDAAVAVPPQSAPASAARPDAMSALSNLGYAPPDAARAVAEALKDDPDAETSALIRSALRRLAPS